MQSSKIIFLQTNAPVVLHSNSRHVFSTISGLHSNSWRVFSTCKLEKILHQREHAIFQNQSHLSLGGMLIFMPKFKGYCIVKFTWWGKGSCENFLEDWMEWFWNWNGFNDLFYRGGQHQQQDKVIEHNLKRSPARK